MAKVVFWSPEEGMSGCTHVAIAVSSLMGITHKTSCLLIDANSNAKKIASSYTLYDDLIKVIKRERKSHFFGSLVSVHNDGEFNEYLVIDGQQRLTTVSLLFLAMYNLMENGLLKPTKENLAEIFACNKYTFLFLSLYQKPIP